MIRCGSFLFNVIVSMVTVSLNSYGVSQSKTYHTFESYRLTSIDLLCYSGYQGRTRGSVSFSLLRRLQNPTLDLAHRGGGPSTPRDIGIKGALRTATLSPRPRPRPVASALQVSQHLSYECNTLRRIATPQTTIVGAKSRQQVFSARSAISVVMLATQPGGEPQFAAEFTPANYLVYTTFWRTSSWAGRTSCGRW